MDRINISYLKNINPSLSKRSLTELRVLILNITRSKTAYLTIRKVLPILFILSIPVNFMFAQNSPCKFDETTLQFVGTPIEQARCLLRPNKTGGVLGDELQKLPKPFEKLIGKK